MFYDEVLSVVGRGEEINLPHKLIKLRNDGISIRVWGNAQTDKFL